MIPAVESSDDVSSVLKSTFDLLNNLPDPLQYGCFLSIMGPLYAVLRSVPDSQLEQVHVLIGELKCEESRKYLTDMISSN